MSPLHQGRLCSHSILPAQLIRRQLRRERILFLLSLSTEYRFLNELLSASTSILERQTVLTDWIRAMFRACRRGNGTVLMQ